jgi:hypothetical protein
MASNTRRTMRGLGGARKPVERVLSGAVRPVNWGSARITAVKIKNTYGQVNGHFHAQTRTCPASLPSWPCRFDPGHPLHRIFPDTAGFSLCRSVRSSSTDGARWDLLVLRYLHTPPVVTHPGHAGEPLTRARGPKKSRDEWASISLNGNRWRLQYLAPDGKRRSGGTFRTKVEAEAERARLRVGRIEGRSAHAHWSLVPLVGSTAWRRKMNQTCPRRSMSAGLKCFTVWP